jgi:GT2 family glycosyltransferase
MRLSIVIPTHDRHELVADCLRTLAAQEHAPPFEAVVVDDGSPRPVSPIVEAAAGLGLDARCLRTAGVGLNGARNRGFAESAGELVAFLDDDTLVDPGWARSLDEGFRETAADVIGGRVVLKLEAGGELPGWLTRKRLSYLSSYDLGEAPREVTGRPLPVGANFAMTRAALDAVGPFREGLDRIGDSLISNGDTEWLRRALAAGRPMRYWPGASVRHRVPPERLTKEWFLGRARAQGISDVREQGGEPTLGRIAREAVRAGRAAPILAKRLAEGRGGFDATLWLAACRARVDELRRMRAAGV